jgi:hypothetical protein
MSPILYHGGIATLLLMHAAFPLVTPARAAGEQIVREQRAVVIHGARESWRLVWESRPAAVCGPGEEIATTCPCSGWAYAEHGKLSLVRNRGGREIERMDLRPLFKEFELPDDKANGSAYLQRWALKSNDMDRQNTSDPNLVADIERRPPTGIMKLADYDRDGAATEFLVQVGTLPCGKRQFTAIGVTRAVRQLHALTSVSHPDKPLVMPETAWRALLKGPGSTAVQTQACGDHASGTREELVVSANRGAIRVKVREYSCPAEGEPEKLLDDRDG